MRTLSEEPQDDMRVEKLQLIVGAVGLGKLDGTETTKKNVMPSSYIGGLRYMTENFHDAVAVSHDHASPDIITTFTCNPKWPEIAESLEPGQKATDRADIAIQVYHMKLLEYLQKIKAGKMFGTVVAVLHTVEFQRRGLPHTRILIWQEKHHALVATPVFINSFVSATVSIYVRSSFLFIFFDDFFLNASLQLTCSCHRDLNWLKMLQPVHLLTQWKLHMERNLSLISVLLLLGRPFHQKYQSSGWFMPWDKHAYVVVLYREACYLGSSYLQPHYLHPRC